MSKSKIFKEEFFNSKTNQKCNKGRFVLDPANDVFMQMLKSLTEFQSNWVKKEGGIPEELDVRCINMLGMRFAMLVPTLFEIHTRQQLLGAGVIDSPFQYIHEMEVDGQKYPISKQEHKDICVHLNALLDNGDNLPRFLDSLADFAI